MATGERLSDSDALMWRIEADPVLRSPIVVVGLLDRAPSRSALLAALERAAAQIPRLRQRVAVVGGRLSWVDDEAFAVEHHLRWTAVDGGGVASVLAVAAPDAAAAFDTARPLWQLTVVTGLDGLDGLGGGGAADGPAGRAGFVLRFHHTISDGVGAIGLAEHLFDEQRRPSPAAEPAPEPAAAAAAGEPAPLRRAGELAVAAVSGTARLTGRAVTDPLGVAGEGVRTARSIVRMLAPTGPPLSPIMLERGLDRHLHVLEVPFDELAEAAHAAGGTVNDAFLAAVGGALHDYHLALGAPVRAVRVTMPISLRTAADEPGGNRFTPGRFVLPIDDPDPARRAQLAGSIVRGIRAEPAVGLTSVLATALNRLPGPVVTSAFGAMLRSMDVDAVDVPGLRRPAFFAGAKVERLWAFAPPTGAAMSITLLSHGEVAAIGLATDDAAVSDPDLLVGCLDSSFGDVLSLAPGHTPHSLVVVA